MPRILFGVTSCRIAAADGIGATMKPYAKAKYIREEDALSVRAKSNEKGTAIRAQLKQNIALPPLNLTDI